MSRTFFIAAALAIFSAMLYLAGERIAFTGLCRYTADLCQHPSYPLFVAGFVFAFAMLFQIQKN
jgi:Kef-type K+ transport system membrane component KefB